MERTIDCSVLTPEGPVFEGNVQYAVVQAHNGEMGFLYNHAPLISELGIGEVRLKNKDDAEYLVIEGGIVEIRDNKMIILAESAIRKDDLNKGEIEKRLQEIKSTEVENFSEEQFLLLIEEKKFKARLKVARR